jgi:hypothetical protein
MVLMGNTLRKHETPSIEYAYAKGSVLRIYLDKKGIRRDTILFFN